MDEAKARNKRATTVFLAAFGVILPALVVAALVPTSNSAPATVSLKTSAPPQPPTKEALTFTATPDGIQLYNQTDEPLRNCSIELGRTVKGSVALLPAKAHSSRFCAQIFPSSESENVARMVSDRNRDATLIDVRCATERGTTVAGYRERP
jgi:hypothetical protein